MPDEPEDCARKISNMCYFSIILNLFFTIYTMLAQNLFYLILLVVEFLLSIVILCVRVKNRRSTEKALRRTYLQFKIISIIWAVYLFYQLIYVFTLYQRPDSRVIHLPKDFSLLIYAIVILFYILPRFCILGEVKPNKEGKKLVG